MSSDHTHRWEAKRPVNLPKQAGLARPVQVPESSPNARNSFWGTLTGTENPLLQHGPAFGGLSSEVPFSTLDGLLGGRHRPRKGELVEI